MRVPFIALPSIIFRGLPRLGLHGPRLPIRVRTPNHGLLWLRSGDYISRRLAQRRPYEPEVTEDLERLLRPRMHVIDVGAHFGTHTRTMSRLVGAEGLVLALEPDPRNFKILEANVRTQANTLALQIAAGDIPRRDMLLGYHQENSGLSSFGPPRILKGDWVPFPTHRNLVLSVPLDRIIPDCYRPVHLIKLDVESHEIPALLGMARILAEDRPHLIVEVGDFAHVPQKSNDLIAFLLERRYTLPAAVMGVSEVTHRNIVACPEGGVCAPACHRH